MESYYDDHRDFYIPCHPATRSQCEDCPSAKRMVGYVSMFLKILLGRLELAIGCLAIVVVAVVVVVAAVTAAG